MMDLSLLLAQTTGNVAPPAGRERFEWARLEEFAGPLPWALLIGVSVAVLVYVFWMYRRDSAELRPVLGWFLMLLRLAAFVGLLLLYLQPQWRTEREIVRNSRVHVAIDTSLSMGINDNQAPSVQSGSSRAEQVIAALQNGDLIRQLRQTHDVVVLRFDQDLSRVATLTRFPETGSVGAAAQPAADDKNAQIAKQAEIDWAKALAPRGSETRLGQALRQIVQEERSGPISGIVVFTDGGQNAGLEPSAAIEAAKEAKLPIHAVGIGSIQPQVNVRVSDLLAPARAYKGDDYTVTAYVQSQGLAGQSVRVELSSRPAEEGNAAAAGQVEGAEDVTLGGDGEVVPVKFVLTPDEDQGRRTLSVRVTAPPADKNLKDNVQEVDLEIVDRETRVLLFAGGPAREYIFLRNQLRRDKDVIVDVLLQTAQQGVSQDANEILDEFPSTKEELYEYDCIVAFDPDWEALDPNQIELLEGWVANQAGGLIALAGPIHMDSWTQNAGMATIRALYPVEFHKRFSLIDEGRFGSTEPWPIDFSREGTDAEFLWLDDTATRSQQAWAAFPGVFGYYSVKSAKPGATVYGYFSDPRAGEGADRQPYLVGQFYGSGRVFYMGSGEMWRLRKVDESYFEQFYTKLVRHVSQGRLLRGSNRGVLLVEQDRYLLGNTVNVRAQLNNAQLDPLKVDSVPLQIALPDATIQTVVLQPIPGSEGTYGGQFTVYQEGAYRLELAVPQSDDVRLARRIQVKLPDLERENPQRNDSLLSELAKGTGGRYFVGLDEAIGPPGNSPLLAVLPDRRKTLPILDSPDEEWEREWLRWMMIGVCGVLCLEWLIRRLARLA